ncbi:MAG: hypothetical protein AAGB93_22310 [Planctomycetota bacterium]
MHAPSAPFARAARLSLPLVALLSLGATASAQHAKTVLFGESNQAGLDLPEERRAVHPITAPFYHEDSFVTSDLRAWYIRHNFSQTAAGGGRVDGVALQVRLALTDRLQFVAYKDGFLDFTAPVNNNESGLVDLGAGLKYAFLQNWETDLHAAVGVGYEFGIGDEEVLQGDDEVRFWASLNKGFDRLHLGATANFLLATGNEDALGDSDRLFLHAHADYWVNKFFSPVVELNYYDTVSEGNNRPLPITGVDVANLGGGADNPVLTGGAGFEIRPANAFTIRAAYEGQLNDKPSLFGDRLTLSAGWSF